MYDESAMLSAMANGHDRLFAAINYADWLEENQKDPLRTKFIRLQCALENMGYNAPERKELLLRQRELIDENGERWGQEFIDSLGESGKKLGLNPKLITFSHGMPDLLGADEETLQNMGIFHEYLRQRMQDRYHETVSYYSRTSSESQNEQHHVPDGVDDLTVLKTVIYASRHLPNKHKHNTPSYFELKEMLSRTNGEKLMHYLLDEGIDPAEKPLSRPSVLFSFLEDVYQQHREMKCTPEQLSPVIDRLAAETRNINARLNYELYLGSTTIPRGSTAMDLVNLTATHARAHEMDFSPVKEILKKHGALTRAQLQQRSRAPDN